MLKKTVVILFLITVCNAYGSYQETGNIDSRFQAIPDKLSIKNLNNIYKLADSDSPLAFEMVSEAYSEAERLGNQNLMLELLRVQSRIVHKRRLFLEMDSIDMRLESIPKSELLNASKLFIHNEFSFLGLESLASDSIRKRSLLFGRDIIEEEKNGFIIRQLGQSRRAKSYQYNKYERIERQLAMIVALNTYLDYQMIDAISQELDSLVATIPSEYHFLHIQISQFMSHFFASKGLVDKAYYWTKDIHRYTKLKEEQYIRRGIFSRDFASFYHLQLMRQMSFFPVLSIETMDSLHIEMEKLCSKYPELYGSPIKNYADFFYHYSKGDYAEASKNIPYMKSELKPMSKIDMSAYLYDTFRNINDSFNSLIMADIYIEDLRETVQENQQELLDVFHDMIQANHDKYIQEVAVSKSKNLLLIVICLALIFFTVLLYWRMISFRHKQKNLVDSVATLTEAVKKEKNAREALQQVELQNSFFANMTHEIRTPLNAIVGFSDLFLGEYEYDESVLPKNVILEGIHESSEKLTKLLDNILDISRLDSGQIELSFEELPVNKVCREIYLTHRKVIKPEVSFSYKACSQAVYANIDRLRFTQIISNLLSNANKNTETGHIFFDVNLTKSMKEICISVSDTGNGIEEAKIPLLFDRFTKLDDFNPGMGLGLPICEMLAKRMKGRIEVESKMGEGSIFSIYIPAILH